MASDSIQSSTFILCSSNFHQTRKSQTSYALMAACNCSRLLPLVSGTTTTINNIASALIAA